MQFHNVLIYVLLGAAVVTAILKHWVDIGVIPTLAADADPIHNVVPQMPASLQHVPVLQRRTDERQVLTDAAKRDACEGNQLG